VWVWCTIQFQRHRQLCMYSWGAELFGSRPQPVSRNTQQEAALVGLLLWAFCCFCYCEILTLSPWDFCLTIGTALVQDLKVLYNLPRHPKLCLGQTVMALRALEWREAPITGGSLCRGWWWTTSVPSSKWSTQNRRRLFWRGKGSV
jgi:hypothetical protein